MSIVNYWLLVLSRAWGQLNRVDLAISLIAGIATAATASLTGLPTWSVLPAFLAGVFAILLLETPARIHAEQSTALQELKESIRPRLSVSVDKPRWRTDNRGVYLQLRVKNEGRQPVPGCYGKLLHTRRMTGAATAGWIPPEHEPHFVWARYQTGENQLTATIPSHSSLFLSIATADDKENRGLFWFEFNQPEPHPLYIVTDLKVEIGAAVGSPIRRWYRITGSDPFEMTLTDIGESDEVTPDLFP